MFSFNSNIMAVGLKAIAQAGEISKVDGKISLRMATECLSKVKRPPPIGMPVDTGTMRRGHGVRQTGNSAELFCSVYYWFFQVYGTIYIEPNDYPGRAIRDMKMEGTPAKITKEEINKILGFK